MDLLDVAVLVAGEADGVDGPVAEAAFLVRAFGAELQRPERPGGGGGAAVGRLGHDFPLMDDGSALAMGGAEAVGAGVSAADDEDALAVGGDGAGLVDAVALVAAVLLGQELHGEVDAVEVAAGDGEVAGLLGTAAEEDGVVVVGELGDGDVDADVGVGEEGDAFSLHLRDAAVDDVLFQLEVGDAVAEQAADAVGLFIDGDGMAGAAKLLRGGQA